MVSPIIHSLWQSSFTILGQVCNATTYDPKFNDSNVACRFDYHKIGDDFKNTSAPVWLKQVNLSLLWSVSTHALTYTSFT